MQLCDSIIFIAILPGLDYFFFFAVINKIVITIHLFMHFGASVMISLRLILRNRTFLKFYEKVLVSKHSCQFAPHQRYLNLYHSLLCISEYSGLISLKID